MEMSPIVTWVLIVLALALAVYGIYRSRSQKKD